MSELISIIVPVYNAEKYLDQCVESLMAQTYGNLEIILINDGSKDASAQMCDAYAAKDERIVVIHKQNGGVSAARNDGLEKAHGEYVMFVDSDDFIRPTIVERMYSALCERQADLCICGHVVVTQTEEKSGPVFDDAFLSGDKEIAEFVNNNYLSPLVAPPWARLLKRALVSRFKQGMALGEDMLFNMEYFGQAKSMVLICENLYCYRVFENSGSLSGRFMPTYFYDFEQLYKTSLDMVLTKGGITLEQAPLIHYRFLYYALYFMRRYIFLHDKKQAIAYIKELCRSEMLRQAAKNCKRKHGVKITLAAILVNRKSARLLYALLRQYKKDNSK